MHYIYIIIYDMPAQRPSLSPAWLCESLDALCPAASLGCSQWSCLHRRTCLDYMKIMGLLWLLPTYETNIGANYMNQTSLNILSPLFSFQFSQLSWKAHRFLETSWKSAKSSQAVGQSCGTTFFWNTIDKDMGKNNGINNGVTLELLGFQSFFFENCVYNLQFIVKSSVHDLQSLLAQRHFEFIRIHTSSCAQRNPKNLLPRRLFLLQHRSQFVPTPEA